MVDSHVAERVILKVALTGGIATGKSYVLGRLRERGVPTVDADDIVHQALSPGTTTTTAIAEAFGPEYLHPGGGVNRAKLGAAVFKDPRMRSRLEAIVHPVVYESIRKWYRELDQPLGVASIPLLYETGHERDFDVVVVTVCPPAQQVERILKRDAVSAEEAGRRIAAQMPADEKARRGDFVILTGGSKSATDHQVNDLLEYLIDRRGSTIDH